ncbi:MAG: hypothetical protein IID46_00625, partial [Planctomycetes bacterium]|nr:hypothetical protein [Planctomycetota bacterium]
KALLKLRATEHQVSRSQQSGGGGGGGGNRSQQQLQQLELSNKQNRYQTNQNAAQANASSANREQLQVLNRLRELARRQGEINEKVKELQTALREAKTQEQKEEIRRRLKRLQEEQQRMLRDIDTLSKRMDQPENQRQMADARKQLDQTRSRVLQSSEALKQGRLSQALNAGTRAERDLENMKEQFRRKTAGRFSEEMKDLKNRANELLEKEKNLAQRLDEIQNSKRRTLRDTGKRDEIREGLQDQKGRIDDLQDRMRKVIQQAENSEPLLSKQLYETVRKSREDRPQKALEIASELVNRGLLPQAEIAEKIARKGIDSLKQGIDKAAQSVLGNELDSLKLAQNTLDQLRKALDKDLAQAGDQQNRPSRSGKQNPSNGKNNPSNTKQSGDRQTSQDKKQQASNFQQSKSQQKGSRGKPGSKQSQGKGKSKGQGQGKGSSQSASSSQANNSSGRSRRGNNRSGSILQRGGRTAGEQQGSGGVLTGDNFQQWSDAMRDVEEMIEDPRLRAQAEKVRERARSMRVEFKRHSKEPNQELIRTSIYEPLVELQKQIAEEIAKKESKDALVPIDRDPVPARYSELVRKYYQELSDSKKISEKTNRKTSRRR